MLVVRPNPRKMRAFLDSPAEGSTRWPARHGIAQRLRWERVFLAIGAIGVVAVVVIALASH
jgi:hypothetical protein